MELGGWIMLIIMWGGVISIGTFCFRRILAENDDDTQL